MQVTKYHDQNNLDVDDPQHLQKLREMIERALRDAKVSKKEIDDIKAFMNADNKVTTEESKLFRELQEKIWSGEIQIDTW